MRGFVFNGPGTPPTLEALPDPEPRPGEVLLRVGANTVCGTDLRIMRGEKTKGVDLGVVLGHEVAGTVAAVGEDVEAYAVGDLCGIVPVLPCGRCRACQGGLEHQCTAASIVGYGVNGGLADLMLVPEIGVRTGRLVTAPVDIPPEHLALAEPLSCCINGLDQYRVDVGDTVVILGAGPIGLLHLQLARLAGATTVVVSDPAESRRAVASELGATTTVDPTGGDLPAVVDDLTAGRGADVAVVCIGRPELVNDALRLVRVRGRVSLFAGLAGKGWAEIEANVIHYREITVVGASNSARAHYERAVDLIGRGLIDTARMLTHRFPLDRASEAIDFVASGEGIKVAVIPDLDHEEGSGHGH